jgi:16S rRNA (guanine(527)-N(7))-methyltransferase RsmG
MAEGFAAFRVKAGPSELGLVRRYCAMLQQWSSRMNLVGPHEIERLWQRHILESAAWCSLVPEGGMVCDIGSGAGLPGVVLAVFGRSVTLLEPRRPKYLFLTAVRDSLGIPGLRVEKGRIEDLRAPSFGFYTARSVGPVPALLGALQKAGASGSALVCRLAPDAPPGDFAEESIDLPVPPLDRHGVLVQYRVPATPISPHRRK